jgi:acetylglutamate kinase
MIDDQRISGGMIPKIEFALKAIDNGIEKVQIINGTQRHSILLELFTDSGIGTEVMA